ncbi:unnamed protein product [Adineta steineri]|uniref:Uncharacterized protein n=1 Tax=Adineta steineri TaxID=433720 RepID=A0A813N7R5_9BILA|nr:unnamed protein product [Adineta steineri]CAF1093895.1 unnamed protein product [Adineta steineri]
MFYKHCCHLILIFILLNLYCYTCTPVVSTDEIQEDEIPFLPHDIQDEFEMKEELEVKEPVDPETDITEEKPPSNELNEAYYLRILCALYGSCTDDDEQIADYDEKNKRLSARLFHGIPKFGKRASAFAGIPKFG